MVDFTRFFLSLGGFYAASATAMLAAQAHALRAVLTQQELGWVETAAELQLVHGIALVVLGFVLRFATHKEDKRTLIRGVQVTAGLLSFGVLLFSAALYGRALFNIGWITSLAPFGGASLILGWLTLSVTAILAPRLTRQG